MNNRKKQIIAAFRKRGLSLSPDALHAVMNLLSYGNSDNNHGHGSTTTSITNDDDDGKNDDANLLVSLLDGIKARLMETSDSSLIVSKELLQQVVAGMTRDESDVMEEALQLLDLNSGIPKLQYNVMTKRYSLISVQEQRQRRQQQQQQQQYMGIHGSGHAAGKSGGVGGGFFGDAEDKVEMLLQRYELIHQRLMRQEHFRPKLDTSLYYSHQDDTHNHHHHDHHHDKITPIEGLLGSKGEKILLGILVQVEEGRYYLEDPSAQVPIDLTHAELLSGGFLTENSICLVEGEMNDDGILVVHKIGQPIYETRQEAVQAIGLQDTDLFGAIPTLTEWSRLQDQEVKHGQDGMFVLLSDVYLDDAKVLSRLETLLDGFQDLDPLPVFVFMGDFASRYPSAVEPNASETIMGYFDDLATVIGKTPRIAKEGKFILVPGQNDPGMGAILPRPPIPNYFTSGLRSKVQNVHLASNPCRLRYFSQEIVMGRLDVLSKLRKECIIPPPSMANEIMTPMTLTLEQESSLGSGRGESSSSSHLVHHAIQTILNQGHLCPVPLSCLPIYWNYDHFMRLYPPPDAIILGDQSAETYFETYVDCNVMNPGPFYTDGGFLVFRPVDMSSGVKKAECEFSQIES